MSSTVKKDRIAQLWEPAGDELDKRNGLKAHQIDTSWDNMAPVPEEPKVKKPIDWVLWIVGGILVVLGLGLMAGGLANRGNINDFMAAGVAVLVIAFIFVVWWTNDTPSANRPVKVSDTRGY